MAESRFQVSESQLVLQGFRRMLAAARARGILPAALRASRWIVEELERTPMEFGESREYLSKLDLHLRIAFAGPVYVEFAVHLPSRIVFVRRFELLSAE